MPSSLPPNAPLSVIGNPPNPYFSLASSRSFNVAVGPRHSGSVMNPFSYRFTLRTIAACSSIVLL